MNDEDELAKRDPQEKPLTFADVERWCGRPVPNARRRTMLDLVRDYGITLPPKTAHTWRLQYPHQGELRGIGHGTLLATDGLLCLVDLGDGIAFEGHLENWIGETGYEAPKGGTIRQPRARSKPKTKKQARIDALEAI